MRIFLTSLLLGLLLGSSLTYAQVSADPPLPGTEILTETFSVNPAYRFTSFGDFAVGVALSGTTLAGETVSTRLTVGPNPEQQLLSAAFLYTRPVDLFTREAASVRVFATTDFTQSYPLTSNVPPEEVRTFTERLNQFGMGLFQPVGGRLEVGLSGRVVGSEAFLEGADVPLGADVAPLPVDGFSVLAEASVRYRSRGLEEVIAPALGGVAEAALGYGLGRSDEPLSWGQIQLGLRGYFSFSEGFEVRDFSVQDRRLTLVGGLDAGANFGVAPAWRRLAPELRGYDTFALVGQRYWDATLELRYYTDVDLSLGQTSALRDLTPYLFVDAGNAWGGAASSGYRAPELGDAAQLSFGAGTQFALETRFFALPLNVWYVRGAQGGRIGFEARYLY